MNMWIDIDVVPAKKSYKEQKVTKLSFSQIPLDLARGSIQVIIKLFVVKLSTKMPMF